MCKSNYEPIANEYYESRHITSRNFDAATAAFCATFAFPIPSDGLVLEIGAGRGRTVEYCRIDSSRIIQLDISQTMLLQNPRESCKERIIADALKLPFLSSTFVAVTAFLYDPFNKTDLYREVARVLQENGLFIGTLPHSMWGKTLRKILAYDENKTQFLSKDKQLVRFDSFLMGDTAIVKCLREAGMSLLQMYDLYLPSEANEVSEHVVISASAHGVSVYKLPIVKLILAKK